MFRAVSALDAKAANVAAAVCLCAAVALMDMTAPGMVGSRTAAPVAAACSCPAILRRAEVNIVAVLRVSRPAWAA